MLRPERMSRVSVTGTKAVMPDVIEAIHDVGLVHLIDYDGSWEGFEPGEPIERADEASEQLVTIRAIESILDLDDETAGPPLSLSDEAIEERLADVRSRVNELDDRRGELRDQLRSLEDRLETAEPFESVGIDLDLLSGYRSLTVRVGEAEPDAIRSAVADLDAPVELYTGDGVVGLFAAVDEATLDDVLVGTGFTELAIPEASGSPAEYVDELERERRQLESRLDSVENDIEELKLDAARFVLAAEEHLTIEVQKTEAPLQFATTENAFVAEGWVPSAEFPRLRSAVLDAAGDRVDLEELERAAYDPPHHDDHAVTDGGQPTATGRPPVRQNNPSALKPFELLVETINRPAYHQLDPTVILFLTFPLFFGFMIGDLGYGLLYMGVGYWLWRSFDSEAIRSLGGIALWAGGFTALFGILYGELFGLHLITQYFWEGTLGLHHPPMEKGLSPASAEYAKAWLVVVVLAGLAHVSMGYVFDFAGRLRGHGFGEAVLESGSWLILMLGAWAWIFSRHARPLKPDFLYTAFDGQPFPFGFDGLPIMGVATIPNVPLFGDYLLTIPMLIALVGLVMLLVAEGGIGLLESLNVLVNILSYARIAAVLLAKAGMAFVVNLLFFGVYAEGSPAAYHFMIAHGPQYVAEHTPEAEILFPGLIHSGVIGVVAGLVILVLGHLVVLALGITSAGLQAVRLEYVEFFSKFYYEGEAGRAYDPFGYERRHSSE